MGILKASRSGCLGFLSLDGLYFGLVWSEHGYQTQKTENNQIVSTFSTLCMMLSMLNASYRENPEVDATTANL